MQTVLRAITVATLTGLAATTSFAQGARKLVTVVTKPGPQTQLMAMVLTLQASRQGVEARILLCGPPAILP